MPENRPDLVSRRPEFALFERMLNPEDRLCAIVEQGLCIGQGKATQPSPVPAEEIR